MNILIRLPADIKLTTYGGFMRKFKVIVADDHPIVLLGVRELVERHPSFSLAGEAICSQSLVDKLSQQPIDLVITDYNMPAESPYGDGLKLISYLKRTYPRLQILVLTMISNTLILERLHELGVAGIIQKNQLHTEIEKALNAIASHSPYHAPVTPKDSVLSTSTTIDERINSLSFKEHEVLRLFVSGLSVSDIARLQNRSSKTISAQKIAAMRKLAVHSDQELLAYCQEQQVFN